MLKKIAFVPDKLYRVSAKEQYIPVGSYYDMNKKKVKSKACYFELNNNNRNAGNVSNITVDYIDNSTIEDVRLISGHSVHINSEYDTYVDNDFIADVAISGMVSKNGKLKGSYIFAAVADKVKLVRIGGPLYEQIIASQDRRSAPKLKKKDFKRGGVYSTPSGIVGIYLGPIHTESPCYGEKKYDSYGVKNRMLFLNSNMDNPQFDLESVYPYNVEVKKTHSFIEMIDEVKVPNDTIKIIREKMIQNFKQEMVDYSTKEKGPHWLSYRFFKYCPLINMYEVGVEQSKKFDINKYMTYL